ncbi:hypothetical protein GW17_00052660 [Ensete ventricosum]|nr:hypothetical protein GW17_00052660 [Ensete ventricosum]
MGWRCAGDTGWRTRLSYCCFQRSSGLGGRRGPAFLWSLAGQLVMIVHQIAWLLRRTVTDQVASPGDRVKLRWVGENIVACYGVGELKVSPRDDVGGLYSCS